jgi:hypothetical protein
MDYEIFNVQAWWIIIRSIVINMFANYSIYYIVNTYTNLYKNLFRAIKL